MHSWNKYKFVICTIDDLININETFPKDHKLYSFLSPSLIHKANMSKTVSWVTNFSVAVEWKYWGSF